MICILGYIAEES